MRGWLLNLRKNAGLTMKETGEKLGISESYYCSIESGNRQKKMDIALVSDISKLFGISIQAIFDYEQELLSEEE